MLPGIDGYEVCRTMRAEGYQAGVIMLTARTQEADKVNGLMNGADDYVTKPFSSIELVARVDALYRRVSGSPFSEENVIKSGPFKLNLRAREVLKNGRKIELTQIEYGLLKAFMQNIGKGAFARRAAGDGVGPSLCGRAEDRRRQHPPPAHQDRG